MAGGRPFFAQAPHRRILCFLQLTEALANGCRITRQYPCDVLHAAMPQLGRLNGRLPTAILLRQPPEEPLHLLFDLGCISVHAVLLAPEFTA